MLMALISMNLMGQQSHQLDSVQYYNSRSAKNRSSNQDKALSDAHRAIEIAKAGHLNKHLADAYRNAGNAHYYKSEFDSAIAYYKKAEPLYELISDTTSRAKTLNNLAIFYKITGNYDQALEMHQEALELKMKLADKKGLAITYNNMGEIFKELAFYDKALDYLFKSLDIKEELNDSISTAYTLNNIGNIFKVVGKNERAGDYYRKAYQIFHNRDFLKGVSVSLNNLGELYAAANQSDKAIDYYNRSVETKKALKDKKGLAVTYNNIGQLYFKQGREQEGINYYKKAYGISKEIGHQKGIAESAIALGDSYFDRGNLSLAKKYLTEALGIAEKRSLLQLSLNAYTTLASLSEAQGAFEKAYGYRTKQTILNDSLFNRQLRDQISELQMKYEIEQKEKENKSLRKERSILQLEADKQRNLRNQVFIVALIIVMAGIIIAFVIFHRKNKRIKKKLKSINEELEQRVNSRTKELKKEIEHRKRIEQELVNINNEYKRVVSSVPDFLWSGRITPEGEHVHLHISDNIEQLTGRPKKYFLKGFDQWNTIVHPDDKERMEESFKKAMKGEADGFSEEYRILKPDGGVVWLYDRETITREKDGSLRFDSIVTDITSRKEMEEQLREANATKDKFLSIIAHDLKVPFNAIMGFSELLNENFDDLDDDEKKSYAKNIISASESAYKLLENLLEWSRAQTGRLEIRPELIDLSVLANNSIKVMKSGMKEKDIKIRSHIKFGTTAWADENTINTVIRNLLSNAIKFTPDKGKIELNAETKGEQVIVSVADTGSGIAEDQIPNLFRIDKKVDNENSNEEGTGLGLILCKEFVAHNGGEIWLESEKGKGTTFYFSLPAKSPLKGDHS
ncbi:MAG: tetratricopeptide repeat protein [Bacteroidales bacterium]|nr:tetratricopeptide repeat protein [Bacteroidales bacterium]